MPALRSLAFNLLFMPWTAVVVLFGMPLLLFGRAGVYVAARIWARGAFWLLAHLIGLRHRVLGRERLPPEPVIAAMKHQSSWDTLAGVLLFHRPAFVLKRELTWIPFFGWYLLRAGMIPLDRRAGGAALRRLLREGRRAAEAGQTILIYPEGTRTSPGTSRPYHPGVAGLYEQLGLQVVPIALNSGLFWQRRSFLKRPGTITMEILEPIPPGLDRRAFLKELELRLEGASKRLAEAPGNP
ncbi:MAG TPA: lysophospholipid acyltransferase family protein [Methylomirabilota bacterium]|jgi:1-acyl-sn-glycerol-3-phosphate acyltransferase|nr:lysophospholipid acyltransferase family protein [Methylomirabilota bacterium]